MKRDNTSKQICGKGTIRPSEIYALVFEEASDGILAFDTKTMKPVFSNPAVSQMTGYPPKQLLGLNMKSLHPKSDLHYVMLQVMHQIEGKITLAKDVPILRRDGSVIYCDVNSKPVNIGKRKLLVGFYRDITKRKEAEEELRETLKKQRQLELLKTEFLSVTSHELRTPITPMRAQLQMLLAEYFGKLTDEQKKSLSMVLRNTTRLDHLIGDIMDISKLQSGVMKFVLEKANLNKVVENAVETMKYKADEKSVILELKEDKIPEFIMDKDRITQVIVNLINNAIKFTDVTGRITVEVRDKKDKALIKVIDTGTGIAKEDQKRIFNPFEQVDSSRSRNYEGTGLGLAICKGIVLNHGGKIWVKSEPGKGSTFAFTLHYKSKIGTKKKSVELFHFGQEETLYKFSQRIVEAGYELKEGKGSELLEADLLRQDGRPKSHISLKDLEKKGYIKKMRTS